MSDDLYREVILDHFKNPRHKGTLELCDIEAAGANPFCGDEIKVTVKIEGGAISGLRIAPQGCAISQASASMMADALEGKSLDLVDSRIAHFRAMMLGSDGGTGAWLDEMEDLKSLEGVKKYPVRVKCALLAWNTLTEGLKEFRQKGAAGKVASEHIEKSGQDD
ncbi:MAG: Fe-S cluster assembly sulfur transfer protein SufU [Elusimicrobiota bacterium]